MPRNVPAELNLMQSKNIWMAMEAYINGVTRASFYSWVSNHKAFGDATFLIVYLMGSRSTIYWLF